MGRGGDQTHGNILYMKFSVISQHVFLIGSYSDVLLIMKFRPCDIMVLHLFLRFLVNMNLRPT